jgi:hypothetical protein
LLMMIKLFIEFSVRYIVYIFTAQFYHIVLYILIYGTSKHFRASPFDPSNFSVKGSPCECGAVLARGKFYCFTPVFLSQLEPHTPSPPQSVSHPCVHNSPFTFTFCCLVNALLGSGRRICWYWRSCCCLQPVMLAEDEAVPVSDNTTVAQDGPCCRWVGCGQFGVSGFTAVFLLQLAWLSCHLPSAEEDGEVGAGVVQRGRSRYVWSSHQHQERGKQGGVWHGAVEWLISMTDWADHPRYLFHSRGGGYSRDGNRCGGGGGHRLQEVLQGRAPLSAGGDVCSQRRLAAY